MSDTQELKAIESIREFYPVSSDERNNLNNFVNLLLDANEKHNLIGKSTIDHLWIRHILDSAQLLKYFEKDITLGDFGSGAGFPGLILSILGVKEVHLLEKSFRKCQFLDLASKISPNKTIIHQDRVENLKNLKFDVVTSRAFAPMNRLLQSIKPFLKKDSVAIFLKGQKLAEELIAAKKIADFDYETYPSLTADESKIIIIKNLIYQ